MAMIDGLKKLSMVTETLEFTSWSMVIMEILAMKNLDQRLGEKSHRLISWSNFDHGSILDQRRGDKRLSSIIVLLW